MNRSSTHTSAPAPGVPPLVTVIFQSVGITAGVTMKNEYSVHATGMDPAPIDTFSVAARGVPGPLELHRERPRARRGRSP
jgi:hypothetical protein